MRNATFLFGLIAIVITFSSYSHADEKTQVDNKHVRTWNKFADDILLLHKRLIGLTAHTVKTRIGGYSNIKDFYKEDSFYDKQNDKLISRIQWERDNPKALHTIEVFIRDELGRVIRDYTAAYLPTYRNAPVQTLVSFHQYNDDLHAFRTFDASGARIVERCTGKLNNKEVNMILDEDEIYDALEGNSTIMEQADYQACFDGLTAQPGKYLTAQ